MIIRATFRKWMYGCGVSILIGTLAIWMFKRILERHRDSFPYNNNLLFVMMAINTYTEKNGHHLPAVINDDKGRPMHSWRVLLLPYLCEDEVAKKYRYDEPWDSVENLKLVDEMPVFYGPREQKYCTLFAVTGARGSWWDNDRETSSWSAALLINVEGSRVPWTQPVDLTSMECQELLCGKAIEKPIWVSKSRIRMCSPGSTIYPNIPTSAIDAGDLFSDDDKVRVSAWSKLKKHPN